MLPGWDRLQDLRRGADKAKTEIKPDITQAVADAADRITAVRVVTYGQGGKPVSKLGAVADRIAAKKVAHDKKADEWAARLDELDKREPTAFAFGDAVMDERETDVKEMEANMRKISNLPNG